MCDVTRFSVFRLSLVLRDQFHFSHRRRRLEITVVCFHAVFAGSSRAAALGDEIRGTGIAFFESVVLRPRGERDVCLSQEIPKLPRSGEELISAAHRWAVGATERRS